MELGSLHIPFSLYSLQVLIIGTVDPCLSEPQLSKHLNYPNTNVTVLLDYFVISVHSIRVNDCSIRVVEQSSVYKSMGFSYPNNFTYLNTFGNYKNKAVQITEDPLYLPIIGDLRYSTIVLYSRDHKGVGMAHEITSPKNILNFPRR